MFSSRDGKAFTLCIDKLFTGFNQIGRGEPLFDDANKPSQFVQKMLSFLHSYEVEFKRSREFSKKLKDLNLLQPMQAQFNLESGERLALEGFAVIDRERLKVISSETLSELFISDQLELMFLHLASLRNLAGLRGRISAASTTNTSRLRSTTGPAE